MYRNKYSRCILCNSTCLAIYSSCFLLWYPTKLSGICFVPQLKLLALLIRANAKDCDFKKEHIGICLHDSCLLIGMVLYNYPAIFHHNFVWCLSTELPQAGDDMIPMQRLASAALQEILTKHADISLTNWEFSHSGSPPFKSREMPNPHSIKVRSVQFATK